MNKSALYFLTFFFLLIPVLSISAPTVVDLTRESGEIQGTVDYCGQSGSEGIEVSIPGKSFMARTDYQGKFTLSYVPKGVWNLAFIRKNQRLGSLSGVEVVRRVLTNLDATHGPIELCSDLDGDGVTPQTDCNDANPRVHPGAPELCGNGLDDNCDGLADESCPQCTDVDQDGYYAQIGCGFVDCDDANPAINPGAVESCGDGVDNDCDGLKDEADANDAATYYQDFDGDGYGDPFYTQTGCNPPDGYSAIGGDCDDNTASINPGRYELCNGIDDNCDDLVDNDCSNRVCAEQETADFEFCMNDCNESPTICLQNCTETVSSQCTSAIASFAACGLSAGCINESTQITGVTISTSLCFYDNCPDQWEGVFGNLVPPDECTSGDTRLCGSEGACVMGTEECVNGRWSGDCAGEVRPVSYVPDLDNDGYTGTGHMSSCEGAPPGYVLPNTLPGGDCDDNDPEIYPDAPELCDGIDNDCDGIPDNELVAPLNSLQLGVCAGSTQICNGSGGWMEDYSIIAMYENPEISSDQLDNDCDGLVDEPTCDPSPCDLNAYCEEFIDGIACVCNPGFEGDGFTCIDIDECSEGLDNCDLNQSCINNVGGFLCVNN